MNLHSTDIRLDEAVVEYLDDQMTISANDATIAITLAESVVDEIRDQLNTVYKVYPRDHDSLTVVRELDNRIAIVTTASETSRAWGMDFIAHIPDGGIGRHGALSVIGAAKKAFTAFDDSRLPAEVEGDAAEAVAS